MSSLGEDSYLFAQMQFVQHNLNKDNYVVSSSTTMNNQPNKPNKPNNSPLVSDMILCGGSAKNETKFHYFVPNQDNPNDGGKLVSLNEYHNNTKADLKFFGAKDSTHIHSFMTDDGSNIIVMKRELGYNVYNIKSDRWLLNENTLIDGLPYSWDRFLFLGTQLLIVSSKTHIIIFDLSNILTPQKIYEYEIESEIEVILQENDYDIVERQGYVEHGMCLINYNCNQKGTRIFPSFILFGKSANKKHYNVIKVDMAASKGGGQRGKWKIDSINDEIIRKAPIVHFPQSEFAYFPFSIENVNGEQMIVMFGGSTLFLYNFDANRMDTYNEVT